METKKEEETPVLASYSEKIRDILLVSYLLLVSNLCCKNFL